MRKIGLGLGLSLVLLLAASQARAQAPAPMAAATSTGGYGMAGCGLGSIVFANDNSKLQILAATTNDIFGIQTFGITSGTSNCVEGGVVRAEREQSAFAEVNFQDLKRNMATGGGEYLASFSTLLGCTDAAKPAFFKMTQAQYASIVPDEKTTPMSMLAAVKRQIKASPALAGSCSDERAVARAKGAAKTTNVALVAPVKAPAAQK